MHKLKGSNNLLPVQPNSFYFIFILLNFPAKFDSVELTTFSQIAHHYSPGSPLILQQHFQHLCQSVVVSQESQAPTCLSVFYPWVTSENSMVSNINSTLMTCCSTSPTPKFSSVIRFHISRCLSDISTQVPQGCLKFKMAKPKLLVAPAKASFPFMLTISINNIFSYTFSQICSLVFFFESIFLRSSYTVSYQVLPSTTWTRGS